MIVLDSKNILLLGSLDFLFDLSGQGILKQNLIISGSETPAKSSIFMVSPGRNKWNVLLDRVYYKEEKERKVPEPRFDVELGWNTEPFHDEDYVSFANGTNIKNWNSPVANGFEGLLYFWTKYVEKSVSIVVNATIHNWVGVVEHANRLHLEESFSLDSIGDTSDTRVQNCLQSKTITFFDDVPCFPL